MISLEPAALAEECEQMRQFRDKHLTRAREIEVKILGNWYRNDMEGASIPENTLFAYMAFMYPELCYDNPAPRIRPDHPAKDELMAIAQESMLRDWIAENNFLAEMQLIVFDVMCQFGMMRVGLEPVADHSDQRLQPYACRVPRNRVLLDYGAEQWGECRIVGHEYLRDLEDLQNDPRADQDGVGKLAVYDGGKWRGTESLKRPDVSRRRQAKLVDLWIPEHKQICTMGMIDDQALPVFIKPPSDWWGPPAGPYRLFGEYPVPGDPYPISRLQAVMEQFEEMQAQLAAATQEAASAKTIWLVEADAVDVKNALLNGKHNTVHAVRGLKDSIVKYETGTMSNQRSEYLQLCRERMDRVLGLGDAQRGRMTGGTATESQLVQSNADSTTKFLRKRITTGVREVLEMVRWYFFHDESAVQEISAMNQATGQPLHAMYMGGFDPERDSPFDSYTMTIDPESMPMSDDTAIQQRWLQFIQVAPTLYQLQQMGFNARWLADQYGSSMNWPNLSEILWPQGSQFPAMPPQGQIPQGSQPYLPQQQFAGQPMGGQAAPMPQIPGVSQPVGGTPIQQSQMAGV